MRFQKDVYGISFGFLWGFCGISMIFLWDFFGMSMIFLSDSDDMSMKLFFPMGFLWESHDISIGFL